MNVKVSAQVRIGRIRYVNTLPFYYGLDQGADGSVENGTPAAINVLMRSNRLDLAPISSLEYAMHPDHYYLMPGLCIGSCGFSGSVLLLSKRKIEELDGERIAVTTESLSARGMLKILFEEKYRHAPHFVESDSSPGDMLKEVAACLVIGDAALFYRPKEFLYKYDLAELWWKWTKLPFCFSVWAVRRKCFDDDPEIVKALWQRLVENTKANLSQLRAVIQEGLKFSMADERFAPVFSYLSNLKYDLDEEMQKGLEHFYELASRNHLFEGPAPALQFAKVEAS